MIELNLLPEEYKKKKRKIELPDLPLVPIAIVVIGILVIIQVLLSSVTLVVQRQKAVASRTWKELAPEKAALEELKGKIAGLSTKAQAIEGLMKQRINWSLIMNELSNSVTTNTWLTELTYTEATERGAAKKSSRKGTPVVYKIQTLVLSGYAAGKAGEATAYITSFVKALRNNVQFSSYFDEIDHGPIIKTTVAGQDVMSFTVNCRFKKEKG